MANAQGMTLSSTSNLNSTQKTMIAAAKEAFEPSQPEPSLVDSEQLPSGHYQWVGGTYARFQTGHALSEADDLSVIEQLRTNTLTLNPTEHGSLATLHRRLARRQGDSSVVDVASRHLARSVRRRQALDIDALNDGLSKSVGGDGQTLDITHLRGAVAYLITDNDDDYGPAPMPLHMIAHAEMISAIVLDLTDSATALRPEGPYDNVLKNWYRKSDTVYGVSVFHSGVQPRDSGDDSKGALKHKEAFKMVQEGDAEPHVEEDGSARLNEYGLFMSWAEGEQADPHGVEMYFETEASV